MTDLKIDYSLTIPEMIIFPLAPAYGFRHLVKTGWLNKTIGMIELFPVLGPVVAVIEAFVDAIFERLNHSTTRSHDRISNPQSWKKEFKTNALEHFGKVQRGEVITAPAIDLSLTHEQKALLKAVIEEELFTYNYHHNKTDRVQVHGNNGVFVFSVPELPGRIFKIKTTCDIGADFHKRVGDTIKAREFIASEGLNLLHVPAQEIITLSNVNLKFETKDIEVLIEQKFDILQGFSPQRSLFQSCISDAELKDFIQECTRQLVVLILKIGYTDVRYDNNPMLTNGQGLALIDLDTKKQGSSDVNYSGLISGQDGSGNSGILSCLTPEMLKSLKPLLHSELTDTQLQRLKLKTLKTRLKTESVRNQNFAKYLVEKNITAEKEQVKFCEWWHVLPTTYSTFATKLQRKVNTMVLWHPGLYHSVERKFEIDDPWVNPESLNRLKQEGKIFDWQDQTSNGYHVWC